MHHSDLKTILSDNGFFAGIGPDHLAFLVSCAVPRTVDDGEVLFRFGDPAAYFYLLRSGCITLEVAALEGPPLELQSLRDGAVLGWSWLIPPYRWSFQARAEARCEMLEFDGKQVLARCESDPAFGYTMLKRFSGLMSERLAFARQKMIDEWRPAGFA